MIPQKHILLVITGHTLPQVRARYGNTDLHFKRLIGEQSLVHGYEIFTAHEASQEPEPNNFDGVIMTGSASMLEEDRPWMHACKKLVKKCIEDRVPYLGVCFGHQVLGAVCGAKVGPNPRGRSLGSRLIKTEKAKIFESLPDSFWVQNSHRDIVLEDRPEFQVIATSDHDERHAIQVGDSAFGIQFHPEWDMNISRAYIDARREMLGEETADKMLATLTQSPSAELVVNKFIDLCERRRDD